jgi:hypothetical protein
MIGTGWNNDVYDHSRVEYGINIKEDDRDEHFNKIGR